MAAVLVLSAHPDLRMSRVNRVLLEPARALAGGAGGALDVPAEQAAGERAELIVWQHPIH